MQLAVGVIIGGAFSAIITALVAHVFYAPNRLVSQWRSQQFLHRLA
jgi:large-conductance mechanosensitive channel